ncbi:MAG: T9SS type A sorting domain-containing protein [Bacteroidales bacterium]|nr:T9SS type A sorting domain-containing protein [Bacteroidales bacterium]
MRVHFFFLTILSLTALSLTAQEAVLPLPYNPNKSSEAISKQQAHGKSINLPLELPFRDDFSHAGPYPDAALWADNFVFINNGFGVHPKTQGVATFDILDETGRVYDHALSGNVPFTADHLTSHPINLAPYEAADSLVLSFYYQPQGKGGNPGREEELVLEFLLAGVTGKDDDPDNGEQWISVWSAQGESLADFAQDTFPYFQRVSIPIKEETYFRDDFRFRFKNIAAIPHGQWNTSGTRSIWNIDYVFLDQGRSVHDSFYYDIAFVSSAESMLDKYTSMPWSQYMAQPNDFHRNRFNVAITNLDDKSYNYTYKYIIVDEEGSTLRTYSGGSWVIPPFFTEGYQDYVPHSNPILLTNPLTPLTPATERHFDIIHVIREGVTGDDFTRNDTIAFRQVFSDYFAYDYGSPEAVHLTKGFNPERVMKFPLAHKDTLEAVRLFFMSTMNNQNSEKAFELVVYSSLFPEQELYSSTQVLYPPTDAFGAFVQLNLGEAVAVEDTFFVGIRQPGTVQLSHSLVLGFDMSNNTRDRLYIKDNVQADGSWYTSGIAGALMMRPVMKRQGITGISSPEAPGLHFVLYPNPVHGNYLEIHTDEPPVAGHSLLLQIFDVRGRMMHSGNFSSPVDVSGLKNGIYLLRITDTATHSSQAARFIISR